MKRTFLVLIMLMLSFSLLNATPGMYDDVKVLMAQQGKILEAYIDGCNAAKSAADVAAVIRKFKDGMKDMIPSIQAIQKKYPDFEKKMKTDTPEELKEDVAKMEALSKKMVEASMKLAQYGQDPEVMKAQQELMEVMQSLRKAAPKEKEEEEKKE